MVYLANRSTSGKKNVCYSEPPGAVSCRGEKSTDTSQFGDGLWVYSRTGSVKENKSAIKETITVSEYLSI